MPHSPTRNRPIGNTMSKETVVLLHGLGRTKLSFWRMVGRMEDAGFETVALGYRPWHGGVDVLSKELLPQLPETGRIHLVGHSLGGVISVQLKAMLPAERRGKIVQLGAPNLGSELAPKAQILSGVIGEVLDDLAPKDHPTAPDPDLGAIAGTVSPDPQGRVTGHEGPNDGLVTVQSALALALPKNQLILPVTHTFMMMDARVIDQTIHFIQTGQFIPDLGEGTPP